MSGQPPSNIPMAYGAGPRGLGGMTIPTLQGAAPLQGFGSVLAPLQGLPAVGGPGSGVVPNNGPGYYGQPSGLEELLGPSLAQQSLGGTAVGAQYGIPDVTGAVPPAEGGGGGFDWMSMLSQFGGGAGQSTIPMAAGRGPSGQVAPVPTMTIDPQTGLIKWT